MKPSKEVLDGYKFSIDKKEVSADEFFDYTREFISKAAVSEALANPEEFIKEPNMLAVWKRMTPEVQERLLVARIGDEIADKNLDTIYAKINAGSTFIAQMGDHRMEATNVADGIYIDENEEAERAALMNEVIHSKKTFFINDKKVPVRVFMDKIAEEMRLDVMHDIKTQEVSDMPPAVLAEFQNLTDSDKEDLADTIAMETLNMTREEIAAKDNAFVAVIRGTLFVAAELDNPKSKADLMKKSHMTEDDLFGVGLIKRPTLPTDDEDAEVAPLKDAKGKPLPSHKRFN